MKNAFVQQFSENIKFKYSCFDRVILRGYILYMFFPAGVVRFLRLMGFRKLSNGVMRILTDQLRPLHKSLVILTFHYPKTGLCKDNILIILDKYRFLCHNSYKNHLWRNHGLQENAIQFYLHRHLSYSFHGKKQGHQKNGTD